MKAREQSGDLPPEFAAAVAALREARHRPEVVIEETAAPQRLAPHAIAITADVVVDDVELASGRLVLLHDPEGHETWEGTFRLVTFARADIEPDLAADPLLTGVGWSWLTEALDQRGARCAAPAGTVTRTASESFGAMADKPLEAQLEVRASWTPVDGDLAPHVEAWTELLCTAAGLAPLPPGVVAIPLGRPSRRR